MNIIPYICARKATPTVASGGEMNGCAGERWVMGTPYKQNVVGSLGYLPPTIVRRHTAGLSQQPRCRPIPAG